MQTASERGKAAYGLWVSVSAHSDIQLAGAYVYAGSVRMQDRKRVASSLALLGHLLLRSCRSDARGADTEQTPNRDRRRKPAAVITRLYATPDPRFSVGLKPGTNVGAGCSCHPTGCEYHRSPRVPLHPVWPRPVARFSVLTGAINGKLGPEG